MKCQVENCTGEYLYTILKYVDISKRRTTGVKELTVEEYNERENKTGCYAVVDNICNVCSDSQDARLVEFIRTKLNPEIIKNSSND
ncbi:hypothetical protein FDH01_gp303 [Acinetobacter phage vB_AbaM_ME3]|uniref:Uncharacterized protein n=1 Tax=Acinetobacter phage vB_AbaM_ME3 TaxID=1837876 RepID=A0A172Q0J4_9CAUD|nr:hypothetical protein FDH01_gp303 [Acinetobacter phage vB_AbaM_ME3]AND75319.1 hypothetical protein ME3_158 [Acinetobacter phage vB_AbaM_ME3]